jgi:predicted RNA-binding Zn ribbon-like protein
VLFDGYILFFEVVMAEEIDSGTVSLWGGRLCLDFTNTVEWHAGPTPTDLLKVYGDLVAWAERAKLLRKIDSTALLEKARADSAAAKVVLMGAIALREALYRIFGSIVEGREPAREDMEIFNLSLSRAMSKARIKNDKGDFSLDLTSDRDSLDWFINRIVWSAAETLRSGELHKLKQCADDNCGWFFWDTSRNRSRRWCSMEDCGNRAKAKRFYRKKKKG